MAKEKDASKASEKARSMKWVKLSKYCDDTGETPNSVHSKRHKGQWVDGVHCKIGPDGNLWVNVEEAEKWVEQGNQATQKSLHAE